jgi:hypothetical protein
LEESDLGSKSKIPNVLREKGKTSEFKKNQRLPTLDASLKALSRFELDKDRNIVIKE